ncbi:hypothetical protein HaLaN_26765, partial [Haematococcus lacustris]
QRRAGARPFQEPGLAKDGTDGSRCDAADRRVAAAAIPTAAPDLLLVVMNVNAQEGSGVGGLNVGNQARARGFVRPPVAHFTACLAGSKRTRGDWRCRHRGECNTSKRPERLRERCMIQHSACVCHFIASCRLIVFPFLHHGQGVGNGDGDSPTATGPLGFPLPSVSY